LQLYRDSLREGADLDEMLAEAVRDLKERGGEHPQ
jgi:hypothetical protein